MDPNKQKQLDTLIWRQRLRNIVPVFLIFGFIAGLFGWLTWDEEHADRLEMTGTVEAWTRAQDESGGGPFIVTVTLPNGARATATGSSAGPAPKAGDTIKLLRSKSKSGRVRYRWMR